MRFDKRFDYPGASSAPGKVSLAVLFRDKKTIEEKQADNEKAGRPKNAGLPWSDESRQQVLMGFKDGLPVEQLARTLQRSRYSIVSELQRQGLVTEEEAQRLR